MFKWGRYDFSYTSPLLLPVTLNLPDGKNDHLNHIFEPVPVRKLLSLWEGLGEGKITS
jgi:hypothetical protein